uniref:Uncharacterized protein n=1 Tax=Arundo donax TaxID=35708 RepID=A0A0A8YKW3_ARUDO
MEKQNKRKIRCHIHSTQITLHSAQMPARRICCLQDTSIHVQASRSAAHPQPLLPPVRPNMPAPPPHPPRSRETRPRSRRPPPPPRGTGISGRLGGRRPGAGGGR